MGINLKHMLAAVLHVRVGMTPGSSPGRGELHQTTDKLELLKMKYIYHVST